MSLTPFVDPMFPSRGFSNWQMAVSKAHGFCSCYAKWTFIFLISKDPEADPRSSSLALTDPNQTSAAREIRRDLIRPYAPLLSADLIESDTDYHVHADLPGVEDLSIELQGRNLVIKAERKVVHDKNNDMVHSVERSYGKVQRQILLPMNADLDNATSKYENGVLCVSFPKKQQSGTLTKTIPITFH